SSSMEKSANKRIPTSSSAGTSPPPTLSPTFDPLPERITVELVDGDHLPGSCRLDHGLKGCKAAQRVPAAHQRRLLAAHHPSEMLDLEGVGVGLHGRGRPGDHRRVPPGL